MASTLFYANLLSAADGREPLLEQYRQVRRQTETICQPLATEDYCIQTMSGVSPPKWHIAHVSRFFETFLLPFDPYYRLFHPRFDTLFNAYYVTHSQPFPRPQRGLLSRPTVTEIYRYRAYVDEAMTAVLARLPEARWDEFRPRLLLGLQHEQQHQELLYTDIKHILAFNPLRPAYQPGAATSPPSARATPLEWLEFAGGVKTISYEDATFCFDNETPRHRV